MGGSRRPWAMRVHCGSAWGSPNVANETPEEGIFGNKSKSLSWSDPYSTYTLEKSQLWLQSLCLDSEHRTHVWSQAKVHLESRAKLRGRRSRHCNDAATVVTEKGARLKHTKSQKSVANPSINMKNLNQDGKSKGTVHHVLCLPTHLCPHVRLHAPLNCTLRQRHWEECSGSLTQAHFHSWANQIIIEIPSAQWWQCNSG